MNFTSLMKNRTNLNRKLKNIDSVGKKNDDRLSGLEQKIIGIDSSLWYYFLKKRMSFMMSM